MRELPVLPTRDPRLREVAEDSVRGGVLATRLAAERASAGGAPRHLAESGAEQDPAASYPRDPLWDALREVNDPEFPISLVDLGLVVDVRRAGARVDVDLTFTAMACPCMDFIKQDVRDRLLEEPDVETVTVNEVWQPAWTRARMTAEGRAMLRRCGVAA